jgi:hypothetical protein
MYETYEYAGYIRATFRGIFGALIRASARSLQVTRHLSMAALWGEAPPMPPRWCGS